MKKIDSLILAQGVLQLRSFEPMISVTFRRHRLSPVISQNLLKTTHALKTLNRFEIDPNMITGESFCPMHYLRN